MGTGVNTMATGKSTIPPLDYTHPYTVTVTDKDDNNFKKIYHIKNNFMSILEQFLAEANDSYTDETDVPFVIVEGEEENIEFIDIRGFVIKEDSWKNACQKYNHHTEEIKASVLVAPKFVSEAR